jgi:hypothetical protein
VNKFPITVFYHYYVPADLRAIYWNWWLDEQLGLAKKSGITNIADFKMTITMPRYWRNLGQYNFTHNFEMKIRDYISKRYPFVDILSVRDTGEENIYEGETLKHLHEHCKKNDGFVAYYHTKGVLSASVETKLWRNLLDEIMINQWQMRYFDIQEYDCTGVLDGNPLVYSGNYFWSKNSYVSTLPTPISTNRFFYETWINTNNPNRGVVIDFKNKDMYNEVLIYGNLDFNK